MNRKIGSRRKVLRAWIAVSMATIGLVSTSQLAGAGSDSATSGLQNASQIQSLGGNQYASVFGGEEVTSSGTLTVFVVDGDSALESAVLNEVPSSEVNFVNVSHSLAFLDGLQSSLTNALPQLEAKGIDPEEWFPGTGTGTLEVGIANVTPSATATITSLLGSGNVTVFKGFAVNAEDSHPSPNFTLSRIDDTAPYHGGDSISNSPANTEGCTSGLPLTIGSATYLTTAAHCYPDGTKVNVLIDTNGSGDNYNIGSISQTGWSNNGQDSELIKTNSSGQVSGNIWTGPVGSPVQTSLAGAYAPAVGQTVCNDGSYSGEVCGLTIETNPACISVGGAGPGVTPTSETLCGEQLAMASGSGIANQSGDSGGPVLSTKPGSSGTYAAGVVSASAPSGKYDGFILSTVTCQYNVTTCYNNLFYDDVSQVLSSWGASIS
jgi:hypothetical protein